MYSNTNGANRIQSSYLGRRTGHLDPIHDACTRALLLCVCAVLRRVEAPFNVRHRISTFCHLSVRLRLFCTRRGSTVGPCRRAQCSSPADAPRPTPRRPSLMIPLPVLVGAIC
jgi:hypothetical protein